ncbi:hypothetical protein NST11_16445 [Caldifermentibacillus hisashii]|uniref:hypothetical protein n=1 Tax=Caldifermentibacillus hisashii TaxID=996558 RepID=UPI002E07560C|nr:hypothetical protein [Caldifermentibacillus hisashii]
MATRSLLVVTFGRETPFFGDETRSRRHFCAEISFFWRRNVLVVISVRKKIYQLPLLRFRLFIILHTIL